MTSFFETTRGDKLAYHHSEGAGPSVIFCPGLKSDMEGSKALFLEELCRENEWGFLRFDYSGHGKSGGAFEDGTISIWTDDLNQLLDHLDLEDVLLVGSSMGGWISLLSALSQKNRTKGLIGIAAAPDFSEKMMWQKWDKKTQERLYRDGRVVLPSDYGDPYIITKELIEDGRSCQVLNGEIDLDIPVKLLHGYLDDVVPSDWPEKISNALKSEDVEYIMVKGGDHSLSREEDLSLLAQTVFRLRSQIVCKG